MSLFAKFNFGNKFSRLEREFMYGSTTTTSLEPQRQGIMIDLIKFQREAKVIGSRLVCPDIFLTRRPLSRQGRPTGV